MPQLLVKLHTKQHVSKLKTKIYLIFIIFIKPDQKIIIKFKTELYNQITCNTVLL